MSTPNDGGSAFPSTYYSDQVGGLLGDYGITAREYFAAHAMQGLLANPRTTEEWLNKGHHITSAFAIADAMLAERSKTQR